MQGLSVVRRFHGNRVRRVYRGVQKLKVADVKIIKMNKFILSPVTEK